MCAADAVNGNHITVAALVLKTRELKNPAHNVPVVIKYCAMLALCLSVLRPPMKRTLAFKTILKKRAHLPFSLGYSFCNATMVTVNARICVRIADFCHSSIRKQHIR